MSLARELPPRLVLLGVRRSLPPGLWLGGLLLLLFVALTSTGAGRSLGPEPVEDGGLVSRLSTWSVLVWFLAPGLVATVARAGRRWRHSDADWFAPRPSPLRVYVAGVLAGTWVAACALVAATALVVELAALRGASGAPDAMRWERALAHPSFALVEGDPPRAWRVDELDIADLPAGSRLVLRPTVAPGSGPAVTVHAALRVGDDRGSDAPVERASRATARIFGRARIELPVPPDRAAPVSLELGRVGPGAVCVLPPASVDVLVPGGSPRGASAALGLRAAAALVAWCTLALGLGAWMRPALAAGLALSLASIPWWSSADVSLLAGADLARAWRVVARGELPPPLGWETAVATASAVAFGIVLVRTGLARGRGSG